MDLSAPAPAFQEETVGEMKLVLSEDWQFGAAKHEGVLVIDFQAKPRVRAEFKNLSSFNLAEERLVRPREFIYTSLCDKRTALFECIDSSYLDRMRENDRSIDHFSNHRHFVLFNENFLCHITCEGIILKRLDSDADH